MLILNSFLTSDHIFEIIKWLTPVALFFLGFLIKWFISRIKDCYQRKNLRAFIFSSVKELVKKNHSQINEIKKCIEYLKNVDDSNILITKVCGIDGTYIREIKPLDYYTLFILKNKTKKENKFKSYRNLMDNLIYIEELNNMVFTENRTVVNRIMLFMERFSEYHKNFIEVFNEKKKLNNVEKIIKGSDPFLDQIGDIQNKFREKYKPPISMPSIIFEFIIKPITNICKKFSADERVTDIFQPIQNAKLCFDRISFERNHHADYLQEIIKAFEEANKTITDSINDFEKSNYKFF